MFFARTARILTAAGFALFFSGCALNYVRYAEYDRGRWESSREFAAPKDAVWQAILVSLENFPIAFTDRDSCFVRTESIEADSLTVFRVGWNSSDPEPDRPAYSRFSIHVTCTPAGEGRTRVNIHVNERVFIPALRLVPYSDQPKPVVVDISTKQRAKGGSDSSTIGYREQLLLASIAKLLGEDVKPPELAPAARDRCLAAFEDDGARVECPGADKKAESSGPPPLQP